MDSLDVEFPDKKILQICEILYITKLISFFYPSRNTQKKLTVSIPLNSHSWNFVHFCDYATITSSIIQLVLNLLQQRWHTSFCDGQSSAINA